MLGSSTPCDTITLRRADEITRGRRVDPALRAPELDATAGATDHLDCTGGIERFVWSGDNILWEMRGPGGTSETGARLNQISDAGQEYGVVGYTHAGGVDRPLAMWKGTSSSPSAVPFSDDVCETESGG